MPKRKLVEKQKRFCQEYIVDYNGTQAVIRAGYSTNNPSQMAWELLEKPLVQEYFKALQSKQQERTGINADMVLQGLLRVANLDPRKLLDNDGTLKPISEWDDDSALSVASIEFAALARPDGESIAKTIKVRNNDRMKALELLGKHLGIFHPDSVVNNNINLIIDSDDNQL